MPDSTTTRTPDSKTTTLTAPQGSQPHLGGVRIGIVDAATRDGVSKAKLLLRPVTAAPTTANAPTTPATTAAPTGEVILTVGDTVELGTAGTLTLVAVDASGRDEGRRPEVTLSLTP